MARQGSLGLRRRGSRLAAVQALYQIELASKTAEEAIADLQRRRTTKEDEQATPRTVDVELFADIVRGVSGQRSRLDAAIDAALENERGVDRVEVLLRLILRAGAYELMSRPDIDAPLSINEYIAVARAFFGGPEPGFINGVLDRIARDVRGGEPRNHTNGDDQTEG